MNSSALLDPVAIAYEIERRKRIPKLAFLWSPARYKAMYSGRGGGKSWEIARTLLQMAAMMQPSGMDAPGYGPRPLRVVCAREIQQSINDSVYALLCDQIRILGLQRHYEVQNNQILGRDPVTGAHTGTRFMFAGLKANIDSIKSLEGADILWVEEAQSVSRHSFDVVVPTIRKAGSEIWLSWNPTLDSDEVQRRFVLNPPASAVVVELDGERDNPYFPERLRIESRDLKHRDPDSWEHVYGGKCRSVIDGAVYGEEMKKAQAEGRITALALDRGKPVYTFWDIGFGDATAIWFAQPCADGFMHVIDYMEDSGETMDHYIRLLQNRGYLYAGHWLPHDAVDTIVHHRMTGGDRTRTAEGMLRAVYPGQVFVAAKTFVHDGINAARLMLAKCRFDTNKCADGLSALRRYQWGAPSASGTVKREPLHDAASHGADAFRILAQNLKVTPERKQYAPVYATVHASARLS